MSRYYLIIETETTEPPKLDQPDKDDTEAILEYWSIYEVIAEKKVRELIDVVLII